MSKRAGGSRTVFVGNIPYDATEEQLRAVFEQAGPVVSLRLKFDRETGKPKGFGFCEFYDEETADSAKRNLDGIEVNGRRLRVDSADSDNGGGRDSKRRDDGGSKYKQSRSNFGGGGESSAKKISNVMQGLQPQQVYNLVVAMKEQLESNPQQARSLLLANPQVTYALVQATVLLGMAPQLVEPAGAPPSSGPAALAAIPQEQRELLQQVLALTPEQIAELPPAEQAQANLLRQQAMSVLGVQSLG